MSTRACWKSKSASVAAALAVLLAPYVYLALFHGTERFNPLLSAPECLDRDGNGARDPFRHLFGEVLVNHLTGRTTNQFEVQEVLAAQRIAPIGGFALLAA